MSKTGLSKPSIALKELPSPNTSKSSTLSYQPIT